MGRKLAGAIAVWILILGLAAAGSQGAARPDPGFGRDGRVLLPARLQQSLGTAVLPDGRIVLAGEKQLVALLPSGRIDRGFGDGGSVRLGDSSKPGPAWIESIAADSRGRLVVAAHYRDGRDRTVVLVARFTPDGRPDPSFGGGDGIVVTDFGLPAVKEGPNELPPRTPINSFVQSVAVDSSDRIVLTGERAGATYWFKNHMYGRFEIYVGRLTATGEADPTFSEDGVLTLPGYEEIGEAVVGAGGDLYFSAGGYTLVHLRADGEFDPGFGENGARRIRKWTVNNSIALDGAGNLLLSVGLRGSGLGIGVKRLYPDGSLDRGFGRGGTALVRRRGYGYGLLASDPRGGILVGASSGHPAPRSAGLMLARLRPDGSPDRGFGRGGRVEVPLERSNSGLQSITVTGSKALLSGFWCQRRSCGTALARIALDGG
jgi:uncharacterized delta-60 repeat protein